MRTRREHRGQVLAATLVLLTLAGCIGKTGVDTRSQAEGVGTQLPVFETPPTLDRALAPGEWAEGYTFPAEFVIADGTRATGSYSGNLTLGVTAKSLFVMFELPGAGLNPWTVTEGPNREWHGDVLLVFISSQAPEGIPPADSVAHIVVNLREDGARVFRGEWNGRAWVIGQTPPRADARVSPEADPLVWELQIPRYPSPEQRGLRMEPGDGIRVAFGFERQGLAQFREGSIFWNPIDIFPHEGYNPAAMDNTTGWMEFRFPK